MIKTKSRVDHCRCYCMNSDILCELWQSADVRLCLIESFTFIHQHSPTRWVKGKGQIMLGFHWYQKQNAAVFLAMICSFHTLRCQVPYNLPEFPVPVSDSGTNVRYRPSHLLVLRVSTSPNMHFSDPRGNPAVSQHREIIFTILCTAYAARSMLIVWWSQKQCPTLLDSWKLRDHALSTWTPRLTWSKRPSWGSSHRCWNSWCWLLLKKNEGLVIFCNF